jgi:hypothetical protein
MKSLVVSLQEYPDGSTKEVKRFFQAKEVFTLFAGQRRRLFERLVPHAFFLVSAETDFLDEHKCHCDLGDDSSRLWR